MNERNKKANVILRGHEKDRKIHVYFKIKRDMRQKERKTSKSFSCSVCFGRSVRERKGMEKERI